MKINRISCTKIIFLKLSNKEFFMKLIIRLPLIIGAVVLITAGSISIISIQISSSVLEESLIEEMGNKNELSADLISTTLNGRLNVLWEIANRASTRTMNWGIIQPNLLPDVERLGYEEIGIVYPDGFTQYVIDDSTTNLGDRDYIIQAFSGKAAISDVIISRRTGDAVVMFAAPIFQSDEPRAPIIGVLIARMDGGQALSNLVVDLRSSMPSGYSYLVNNEGTFIAHRNTEIVANQFNPIKEVEEDPSLRPLANFMAAALRERNGFSRYYYEGRSLFGHYTEIPGFPWLLFSIIERSDIDNQLIEKRMLILSVALIFVIVGLVIAFFIGKSIAKPIRHVAETMKDISEGEGDLTKSITFKSKDEVGDLVKYFNQILNDIREMVINIRKEAGVLSDIGDNLASNMNETAAAVNEITANIQSIKGRIINQSASVSETHATMEQVVVNINKLNGHVENQSNNVSQASSAIEQMVANTRSVTDTLIKNAANVDTLRSASEVGRNGLSEVAADIQEIARESEGLLEINSVMENIASQTNLLSMNAAIEAAHAGESGKGFAVVADEIRKLAENSGEQSKIIGTVLKKITESINKITRSTENVLKKFEAIDSSVKTVAEQEENIRNAMEEQGTGSKQILEGVSNVNEITRQVKGGSQEMLEGAKEVIQESENLEKATQEITSGMNEMASGAEQINVAVHHVNELSIKNREGIDILIKEVSRFKVD